MISDKELIDQLGGPSKVAQMLGYDAHGGVQRVHNWTVRGIPARVKLEFPEIFLREQQGEKSVSVQPQG